MLKKDETKIKKKLGLVHSGSITVRLVSSFTNLDTTASLHPNNNIRSLVVKSSLVKLETNCTLILSPPQLLVLSALVPTYIVQGFKLTTSRSEVSFIATLQSCESTFPFSISRSFVMTNYFSLTLSSPV